MTDRGQVERAPDSSGGDKGRPIPNEQGLRALGDLMNQDQKRSPGTAPAEETTADGRDAEDTDRVANHDGLSALAESMRKAEARPARHSARKGKGRRRVWRGAVIGLVVLLVVVLGGAGYAYYLSHGLNRIDVKGLNQALNSGKEAGTENILMVGSTSRCALKVQNPAYGLCSEGVNGVNSDVIMILHVDPARHRLAILSLPRDLFVPNARSDGPNKIDAGLYQGISQVVATVQEDFGIPIQHTVSLNFDQFANVVDALGGIDMSFPMSVFDAESGLNVQAAACVHLNGTQALEVVRARHLQYQSAGTTTPYADYWPQETLSDLARIRRDHEFLRVLGAAVAKQGLGNPITDINLVNSVKADLSFDQSWSVGDMADLVLDFHSVSVNAVPQLTLPVSVVTDPDGQGGSLMYQGAAYGDAEFPSESQDQSAIDQLLGIDIQTDSMTGKPLPAPSSVTVSVTNGSGAYNQATDTASALAALGFHTVGVGDSQPVGDVSETVVYYRSTTAADEAAAEAVTRSLSGAVVMAYDPSMVDDGAQVTVVTGTQFAVNPPPTPSTSSSTGAAAPATTATTAPATTTPSTSDTSSTSTTSPTASDIEAPSPTTSKLEPWDPRACHPAASPTAPVPNQV